MKHEIMAEVTKNLNHMSAALTEMLNTSRNELAERIMNASS